MVGGEEIEGGRERLSFCAREEGIHGQCLLARYATVKRSWHGGKNRGEEEERSVEKQLEAIWRVPIWDPFFFFFF